MDETSNQLKARISGVFDRTASTYDRLGPRFFSEFGRRLTGLADVPPGSRVLDVATGRGELLFPLAAAVGPSGFVTGIDLSPAMVSQTRLEIECRGVKNAAVHCMDAEDLSFSDGTFDHVLCGFALFFFPSLDKALGEFKRVLKPGSNLAVSIWGEGDPRWSWLGEVYEKYKHDFIAEPNIMPSHFHEAARLEEALQRAGFEHVLTALLTLDFVYQDADEWWNVQWSHVNRSVLESIDPAVLADFKSDLFEHIRSLVEPDGIHQQLGAIFTLASRGTGMPEAHPGGRT